MLATGHAKEPAAIYEEQLLRTPNRTPAIKALAEAKSKLVTVAAAKP